MGLLGGIVQGNISGEGGPSPLKPLFFGLYLHLWCGWLYCQAHAASFRDSGMPLSSSDHGRCGAWRRANSQEEFLSGRGVNLFIKFWLYQPMVLLHLKSRAPIVHLNVFNG